MERDTELLAQFEADCSYKELDIVDSSVVGVDMIRRDSSELFVLKVLDFIKRFQYEEKGISGKINKIIVN